MKCNQSRRGFELVSPSPFPARITIIPRAVNLKFPGRFSVFWSILIMLSFRWSQFVLPIFSFSSLFSYHSGTVPHSTITIVVTFTHRLNGFLRSQARSKYLFIFLLALIFTMWSTRTAKFTIRQVQFLSLVLLLLLLLLLLFTPFAFFTSVLTDCFSLEFKWHLVSSSLQDSSQDSSRS